jgi:hypothetical protein
MSRTTNDTPMREAELQDAIVEMAMMLGWKVMHTRPARTATGHWRTPLQGHRGFPDLCMVRPPRLVFAELKSASGKLTPEQEAWLDAIDKTADEHPTGGGPETYVWTPKHWRDGLVEERLR